MSNLTITDGASTHGSGVYVAKGLANIVSCTIVGNHSTTSGGGVYIAGAGEVNIVNSLIAGNSAKYGGGVYSMGASGKSVVITNSTIAGNSATSSGSGLHSESANGTIEIRNTIIALNSGKADVQKKTASRSVKAYNTLSPFTGWSSGSSQNLTYEAGQPLFAFGGYALAQGSAAVNAGNNSYIALTSDLAGDPRIVGSTVDLGAYELQSTLEAASTVVTTTQDVVDPEDNLISLREAVAYADAGGTVTFDASLAGQTFTLTSELLVEKSVSIDGGANNIALSGGGQVRVIRFLGADTDVYTLSNLTITKGATTSGAGVYVATGTANIVNCTVKGNTSSTSGGGVYVAGAGAAKITNTLIAENSAKYGGGLFVYGRAGKSVVVTNTTITGNKATTNGSGLFTETADGTLEIRNSIIALNMVKSDVYKKASGRVIKAYNTLSPFTGWSSGSSANLTYNASQPLFVGADDYSLAQGSQALNAGNNAYITLATDLSGNSRIVGSAVDLGAYERQSNSNALLDEAFAELFEDDLLELF